MKANDIKKGNVVEHNNEVYQIRDIERSSPQGRGGNVTFRFTMYTVPGGNKLDLSLRADDELREIELSRRQATYSYREGDTFVFMDAEDYTQYMPRRERTRRFRRFHYRRHGNLLRAAHRRPAGRAAAAADRDADRRRHRTGNEGRYGDQAAGSQRSSTRASRSCVPEYIVNGSRILVSTVTGEYSGRE